MVREILRWVYDERSSISGIGNLEVFSLLAVQDTNKTISNDFIHGCLFFQKMV